MRDPYTNEIGKTLVFCVSQKHAVKITTILNELAEKYFPNQYQSDFAIQVTSSITSPDPQQMTIDFKNNNLNGNSPLNELYKTSKARVCVTVGMMTTGYDCKDLLNICLFRPVFSPTEFIQMKGRGTRLFDFKECWIDEKEIPKTINSIKSSFKLFDYFKNYQYFEEEFDNTANQEQYWFTSDKMEIVMQVHNYLAAQPEIGNVASLATMLKVGEQLNDNKPIDGFLLALIYNKLPEKSRIALHKDFWTRYNKPNAEKAIEAYYKVAKKYELDLAQMSLKFLEIQPFVTSVIIGATTMEQLKTDIESVNINLTEEIINEINEVQKIYPNPCP